MSITISFSGNTADEIRAEALAFFGGTPVVAESVPAAPPSVDKDVLVARAQQLGVEGVSKRWGVERLQNAIAEAETALASQEEQTPEPVEEEPEPEDPFALDEPEPEPAATKADVREALVAYQTKVKERLVEDGEDEKTATGKAMRQTQALLAKVSGSENFGGLDESKYADVIDAAVKAKARL